MNKKQFRSLGLLLCALLLTACASAGRARNDAGVYESFRTQTVAPSYRYWYLNQENDPYAVVGLAPEWRMEDKLWRSVEPGTPTFQKVVGLVDSFPAPGLRTYGAQLVDHQGNPIGIWFSSLTPGILVDEENRQVSITTATPWMGGPDGGDGRP